MKDEDWKHKLGDVDLRKVDIPAGVEGLRRANQQAQQTQPMQESDFESADFLCGYLGEVIVAGYKEKVIRDFENNSVLNVLKYNGMVEGSNPFAVVLLNQLLPKGQRIATPADLEEILRKNTLNLQGFYEDSALVLRGIEEPNLYLAKNLAEQITARQELKFPSLIPLCGLKLVKDEESGYGLAFKLKQDAQIIYAPQLSHENDLRRFSETDKNGLPIFDENGTRTLYTTNSGLSRLYLVEDLELGSGILDLAYSSGIGRIIVVKYRSGK